MSSRKYENLLDQMFTDVHYHLEDEPKQIDTNKKIISAQAALLRRSPPSIITGDMIRKQKVMYEALS